MKSSLLIKSLSIGAFLFLSVSCNTLKTGSQAMMLTNEQVASMVKSSVQQMDAQNNVAPDNSAYTQRLKNLTSGIESVGNTPLNFKVYITDEVNAFACPDGSVRVYSGIMDMMNDDQLLGIIGHEIGHVGLEHSKKQIQQQVINEALLQDLASLNSTTAAISNSQLGQVGKSLISSLASSSFSRKEENEADDFGYEFLQYCGKNPYCMVEAFEKMQTLENQASSGATGANYFQRAFSSHPETSARIKHLEERCKKDGYSRPATQTSKSTSTTTKKAASTKTATTKKATK